MSSLVLSRSREGVVAASLALALLAGSTAFAQDPSGCSSELDSLSSEAEQAKSEADEAEEECEQAESECDDYDDCLAFPDVYDLLGDGCVSTKMDCQFAKSSCATAVSSMKSSVELLGLSLPTLEAACDVQLETDPVKARERLNELMKKYGVGQPPKAGTPTPVRPTVPPQPRKAP